MFKNLIMWILNNVFHIQTQTTQKEVEDNTKYALDYENIDDINFNAIFSNKLANYTIGDSELDIIGENERAKILSKVSKSMWKKMSKIVSMAFGYGGVLLIPYVQGAKLHYNIVSQNRLTIDMMDGEDITGATILAEKKTIQGTIKSTIYYRWTNYQVKNGNIEITQEFSNEEGKKIPAPDFWKNIPTKMEITGVDRCLFGYIKSPINNRRGNDKYGVPITYGCDATILEIKNTLKQLAREYELKQAFVGIDDTLFNGNNKASDSGLFKKFSTDSEDFFQVFDPEFRNYMDRLEELYRRLEHEVGTSGGILSQVQTANATATEIKRAMYDTFVLISQMRANIEKALEDFFYSCDVLSNAYNVTPQGEYDINYDWEDGLVEDSNETFSRMITAESKGIISKAEIREWLHPEETLEESQEAIDEIQEQNPSIEDLLGTREDLGNNKEDKKGNSEDKKKNIKE